jgi:hypothetical protein
MNRAASYKVTALALATAFAGATLSSTIAAAPASALTGQARAVRATTIGTTVLADTGTLAGAGDARDATLATALLPSLLNADVVRAVTVGWPDQVVSEASLANLNLTIGLASISADFVMASVVAVLEGATTATTRIGNLSVNGVPVLVTGVPNQTIAIPGGRLVINEQRTSATGTTVNALHASVLGVADVVVASATAGIQ